MSSDLYAVQYDAPQTAAPARRDLTVIIPFFQREPGMLARALRSIVSQTDVSHLVIRVLVIDDQSPSPPRLDIDAVELGPVEVEVIAQPNGGPAAARNTGLEAVAAGSLVALLDSDDVWSPHHLNLARRAISAGADLYFANNRHEGEREWFADHPMFASAAGQFQPLDPGLDLWWAPVDDLPRMLLEEAVMHPSCLVYDFDKLKHVRFPKLVSGEDHLFSVQLAAAAGRAAVCLSPQMERGDGGINYYRDALDWNSPRSAWRALTNLIKYEHATAMFDDRPELQRLAAGKARIVRSELLWLLLRNARRYPSATRETLQLAWRTLGLGGVAAVPRAAADLVRARLTGRFEFRT